MNWTLTRKITLTVLIALSLFLTVLIWRNPGGYVVQTDTPETSVVSSVTFDRQLTSVFGSTEVVYHTNQTNLLTKDPTVLGTLPSVFQEWEINDIADPITLNGDNYIEAVSKSKTVEFIFPNSIPFGVYQETFSFLPREYENRTFNRVYISIDNPQSVYFYNTHSMLYYEAEASNIDLDLLTQVLNDDKVEYLQAESVSLKEHIVYLPVEAFEIPVLNYLVEEQPNSLFIERLFEDTSEIQTVINDNLSRYYDYFSELSIDNEKDMLTYTRPSVTNEGVSLTTTVLNSFNKLIQYEHWPNDVYYYGYSSVTKEVEFRRYIKGYPIFGEPDYGGTFITVADNNVTSLEMPTIVAQTPISDNQSAEKMYSLQNIEEVLSSSGHDLDTIDDIKVGYIWNYSSESNRVVTLIPSWYVEINGNWMSLQSVVNADKGGADDGF